MGTRLGLNHPAARVLAPQASTRHPTVGSFAPNIVSSRCETHREEAFGEWKPAGSPRFPQWGPVWVAAGPRQPATGLPVRSALLVRHGPLYRELSTLGPPVPGRRRFCSGKLAS
jgi:hypothetical protein